jgi:hypothetical protein
MAFRKSEGGVKHCREPITGIMKPPSFLCFDAADSGIFIRNSRGSKRLGIMNGYPEDFLEDHSWRLEGAETTVSETRPFD